MLGEGAKEEAESGELGGWGVVGEERGELEEGVEGGFSGGCPGGWRRSGVCVGAAEEEEGTEDADCVLDVAFGIGEGRWAGVLWRPGEREGRWFGPGGG